MDPTGKINISFSEEKISSRLRVYRKDNLHQKDSFAEDVILGLNSGKKFLLPKYFYDKRGSELFERICETEEYYPTRTEIGILKKMSGMISERNTDKDQIIELGSGSSVKTEYFISSFLERQRTLKYIPIDISDIVVESSRI